jgi:hypothetical protein
MTCMTLLPTIGQHCLIDCDGLNVAVTVIDAKSAYGRTRLQVRPVAGGAETVWVETGRVRRLLANDYPAIAKNAIALS